VYAETGSAQFCGDVFGCDFDVVVLPFSTGNEGIDVELSMTQSIASPQQYTVFERTVSVQNAGTQSTSNVIVSVPLYAGMVFSGGEEFDTDQGNYSPYGDRNWTVGVLAPGASASLTLRYFALTNTTSAGYAQVITMAGNDIDSTPNNGTPPIANEDDEATTSGGITPPGGNQADLSIANFNIANTITKGAFTDYTFDLVNNGNAVAAGNYDIKLYLSTDNTLSGNDAFVGDVKTGNTPIGTIANVGAQLRAQFVQAGNYFLIVSVDADNDIAESNENNNTYTQAITVVTGGTQSSGADLNLSASFISTTQPQYDVYSIVYNIKNEGSVSTNNVQVDILLVPGAVYSGGDEFTTTQGTFSPYGDNVWNVGTLNAGQEATLTINYYKLNAGQTQHFAQVISSSANDPDSTPDNGTYGLVNEDDEVFLRTNVVQSRTAQPSSSANKLAVLGVFPNPSNGQRVMLRLESPTTSEQTITFYDVTGRVVATQSVALTEGINQIRLETQNFAAGYYTLLVEDENLRSTPQRFIIERN